MRLWRRSVVGSLIVFLIASLALLANLSNSLGFLAGRNDVKEAASAKARDQLRTDRAEFDRLTGERQRLPAFIPASASGVDAAREAVKSAETARAAECAKRGENCRQREADERTTRAKLIEIESNFAASEKASELDGKVEDLRKRLNAAKPVERDNAQASALGLIFKMPAATVVSYQQLSMAIIVELLIVGALVAFELMSREVPERTEIITPRTTLESTPTSETTAITAPRRRPEAIAAPKSVAKRENTEDVATFVMRHISPADGQSVTLGVAYDCYIEWCTETEATAIDREAFENWFRTVGKSVGLEVKRSGTEWVCNDVALAS